MFDLTAPSAYPLPPRAEPLQASSLEKCYTVPQKNIFLIGKVMCHKEGAKDERIPTKSTGMGG